MEAGIKFASGEVIVPLDADMQNDPADIPKLIAKLEEGYDIVSGWRKARKDEYFRMLLSRMANRLIVRTTGVDIHDYGCTLKAYRSSIVKNIDFYGEIHRLIPVYASWQGARITEMEVNHYPRKFGYSKYGFSRIGKLLLDLLVVKYFISYAQRPIYFFGWLAILSFVSGFLSFGVAVFLRFVYHISLIETPLPLLTALLMLAGFQLLSMGIIADMIIRTRANKTEMIYSVKEKINLD
jgi:dolichol-phosphate mannosyltransferase